MTGESGESDKPTDSVSAPFCCSTTPLTPLLGLHLAMCPPPSLRAGCPHLPTSTGGTWRTQSHSPRVAQHILLTGWGAIPEASSFPGKEPACSPHYQSNECELPALSRFPFPNLLQGRSLQPLLMRCCALVCTSNKLPRVKDNLHSPTHRAWAL